LLAPNATQRPFKHWQTGKRLRTISIHVKHAESLQRVVRVVEKHQKVVNRQVLAARHTVVNWNTYWEHTGSEVLNTGLAWMV
jgi:O-acetylhomoserine/O-acetylserine sulfhydrylase-like pyridoxal-dependent enzyme